MTFKYLRFDVQSSVVTFLVALPLCLGIALASNAPLVSGLYAGIIGGIVIGLFSGSNVSVSGPAAGLTVIVVTAIDKLGSFEIFTAAVVISGVLQVVFSFFRAGNLGNYFPSSVIKGMLAAIGLILILKQIPHAVGYDHDYMGDDHFLEKSGENTFSQLFNSFRYFNLGACVLAAAAFALIFGWDSVLSKKFQRLKLIPGALIAVVACTLLNEMFNFVGTEHLVQLPFSGGVKGFVDGMNLPGLVHFKNPQVWFVAATIAIVGSLESLLSIDAADKLDPAGRTTDKNRELKAQGLGNFLSGLVGGLPVTAVIVRTTANVTAGAKTKLSAVFHGFWLAICAILIPGLLNKIPLASLATILIMVGYKLAKPEIFRKMLSKGSSQFVPFVVTILAILFTDLLVGIIIGMVVGFAFVLRSNIRKSIVMVQDGNYYLIKFYKDVSFIQRPILSDMLNSIPDGSMILIDGSSNVYVDADIEDLIEEFVRKTKNSDIRTELRKSPLALSQLFKG